MPIVERPKKKKIRVAITVIVLRQNNDLDNDVETGANFDGEGLLRQVYPILETDSNTWSKAYGDVWEAADAMCDGLDQCCDEAELGGYCANLEVALAVL